MLLFSLFSVTGAWTGEHTPQSRELAEDVIGALGDIGMSRKCAALTMDIPQSVLSEALSGVEMLSAWRMAALPGEFWVALAKRRLARIGSAVVVDAPELMLLIHEVRELVRGGKRRMLRMRECAQKEGAA